MLSEPPVIWLPENFSGPFPSPELALLEPDGLLAAGANLEPETLLQAYKQGIFPWYSDDQPILWWSPNPRCVLFPDRLHIARSLRKTLNKSVFTLKIDTAFERVIQACARPRQRDDRTLTGTWITDDMVRAYCRLHQLGHAHSIECWHDGKLVGGLYGIQYGQVFYGESMFSSMNDASKIALVYLCQSIRPALIDVQVHSAHMERMGAENIARNDFMELLKKFRAIDSPNTAYI